MTTKPQLLEDTHERAGLRLIRRAIHGRWDIPDVLLEQLPKHVTALLVNARNDREKLRAAEVIVSMNRDNISALVQADKIERLEAGLATDRVEVLESMTDAQMRAVAESIAPRKAEDKAPAKPRKPRAKRKPKPSK